MPKRDTPLGPSGNAARAARPSGAWQDAELAELLRIWPVLDVAERRALIGFIRHIVKSGPDEPPSLT